MTATRIQAIIDAAIAVLPHPDAIELWRKMILEPDKYLTDQKYRDEWQRWVTLADLLRGME